MSMKKTDLVKNLAKKLDGRMKATGVPPRFAQGSAKVADTADAADKREKRAREAATKLVAVSCRLPAEMVAQLRVRAVAHEGGINALLAQAVQHWLDAGKRGEREQR